MLISKSTENKIQWDGKYDTTGRKIRYNGTENAIKCDGKYDTMGQGFLRTISIMLSFQNLSQVLIKALGIFFKGF